MSETAEEVITSALEEIVVQSSEAPLEPDELQVGIRYLNRMMASFAAKGITLGYTVVTSLGDTITVPDGALDGMVSNLAIRLFPQYSAPGTPIDPLLIRAASDGFNSLLDIAITSIGPTAFPDTLPIGSGNEGDVGLTNQHFYAQPDDPILTESGGFISIESETEAT